MYQREAELIVAGGDAELHRYTACIGFDQFRNCSFVKRSMYVDYYYGLLKLIFSDYLQLRFQTVLSNGGYGRGGTIQNSTGIVRDILYNHADVSAPDFAVTYDRSMLLSYGPVLTHTARSLLVNHRFFQPKNSFKYWTAFSPYCSVIWTILMTSLWVIPMKTPKRFASVTKNCFVVALSVSWLFFNVLFGSRLIETRSVSASKIPFRSLRDSADSIKNSHFRLIFESDGTFFENTYRTEPQYHELRAALKVYPVQKVTTQQYGRLIANSELYFSVCSRFFAQSMALRYRGKLNFVEDNEAPPMMQAIAYNRNNSRLGHRIVMASLSVIEAGHLQKLGQQQVNSNGRYRYEIDHNRALTISAENDLPIKLSDLANTLVCLYIVLVGVTCVFIAEWRVWF